MANLITRARALYNLNNLSTSTAENTTLDALIAAVSAAMGRYCLCTFVSTPCDEVFDGTWQPEVILDRYPILAIDRVAYAPTAVLRVQNTSAGVQRATVQVTSTGLTLTRVAAGVSATDTPTFAGNVTLTTLAAAINALGNGWSASLVSDEFADRASADLRALQGALAAKNAPAELKIHLQELTDYDIDGPRGLLIRLAGWRGSRRYWRVIYTAGYAAVPDDVQEACAQWVAELFWQTKRDPGLALEVVPGSISRTTLPFVPWFVRFVLDRYSALEV